MKNKKIIIIGAILFFVLIKLAGTVKAVDCGWSCSGTTASCKSGGSDWEYEYTGYCSDGSQGACEARCTGSIDADVNCGGIVQHISCDSASKINQGCCLNDPPEPADTNTPVPPTTTVIPSPTPTGIISGSPSPTTTTTPPSVSPTPGPLYICTQQKSITLSDVPVDSGNVTLKLQFQGVLLDNIAKTENKTQKIDVTFIKQITTESGTYPTTVWSKTFPDVSVTTDSKNTGGISIWSGMFSPSGIPVGDTYAILVKGPKHLQKKFCVNNPTEQIEKGFPYHCKTAGSLTLLPTTTTFDFSNVLLQAGDLPVPNTGQDGVVNALDVSYILNILKNGSSTDATHLSVADIDLNGMVNEKDRSYLLETLEEKYGDDE
jgi:hypothetical protein